MAESHFKATALFHVLLLLGQECLKIRAARMPPIELNEASVDESATEVQLETMNKQTCRWSLTKIGCTGADNGGCKFRPLPLDRGLSDACRLSNEYMLANESFRDTFIKLESATIVEKSIKIKEDCAAESIGGMKKQWLCFRRAGRMLHVVEFMSEAQKKLSSESDIDKQTQQKMESDTKIAYENFVSSVGDAGPYLLKLKEKAEANAVGIVKDPVTTMRQIAKAIFALTGNNETAQEEARSTIDAMPTSDQREVSAEEVAEMTKSVTQLGKLYKIDSESKAWDLLRSTVPLTGKPAEVAGPQMNSTASNFPQSLMQMDMETQWYSRGKLYSFLRTVIIFALILVLCFIVFGHLLGPWHWLVTGPVIVVFAIIIIEEALGFLGLHGGGGGSDRRRR